MTPSHNAITAFILGWAVPALLLPLNATAHGKDEQPSHHHHADRQESVHRHDQRLDLPAGEAPGLDLIVRAAGSGDWGLSLDTRRFRFDKAHADGPHAAGEGHAHLYVDGRKISRIYEPEYRLPALSPGAHEIEVGLFTNDHRAYAVDGRPVASRVVVLQPASPAPISGEPTRIGLPIHEGSIGMADNTLRVTQGDWVELDWSSDQAVTLHLHGYDIEAEVGPDAPLAMLFPAGFTGRFPVERHGGPRHKALAYLEVHPK